MNHVLENSQHSQRARTLQLRFIRTGELGETNSQQRRDWGKNVIESSLMPLDH